MSHTGVAGLTLGGGMGWLLGRQGLSSDNLVEATLVTADGHVVTASEQVHPELFWGLRGAGANFGVVTELVFGLHEVDPVVNLGLFFWLAEDAAEPLRLARDRLFDLPDGMGAAVVALSAPPEPFVPEEHHGLPGVAVIVVGWGSAEEHAAAIAPLREEGRCSSWSPRSRTWRSSRCSTTPTPWGVLAYDKGLNLADLSDEAIDVLLAASPRKRSPLSYVPIFALSGRYREIPDDATAWGTPRSAWWAAAIVAFATDEETLAADRAWARDLWRALRPHAGRGTVYVNFDAELDDARVRATYGTKYHRLAALKARWDPDNTLCHNANIPPALEVDAVPVPRATAAQVSRPAT